MHSLDHSKAKLCSVLLRPIGTPSAQQGCAQLGSAPCSGSTRLGPTCQVQEPPQPLPLSLCVDPGRPLSWHCGPRAAGAELSTMS